MSYLGDQLDLPDGSRLTGIVLLQLAGEAGESSAALFLHCIRFGRGMDADPAVGALARFMGSTVATLSGAEPDGSAWGALIQYAAWPRGPRRARRKARAVADSALGRALELTGITGDVRSLSMADTDLRVPYLEDGAEVDEWNAIELLIGLLYELASETALSDVVDAATNFDLAGDLKREYRDAQLNELLYGWAATYEGPAC